MHENLTEDIISGTGFETLKTLFYKDIYINNLGLRILGIHYMNNGKEWDISNHRHSFYEMHYVFNGEVCTVLNGMEHTIREGYFYIMSPGTRHSHMQKNDSYHIGIALRWEYLNFKAANLENYIGIKERFIQMGENIIVKPFKDDGTVITQIRELLRMANENYKNFNIQLSIFSILENALSICSSFTSGEDEKKVSASENRSVEMAVQFVKDNCCENISVNDIANSVHISYSHLAKLFREHRGESLSHYIIKMRIQKAFKLLTCTDMTLSQIANETGFENSNYFCKVFRKIHKKSPGSVRRDFTQLPDE